MWLNRAVTSAAPKPQPPKTNGCYHPTGWAPTLCPGPTVCLEPTHAWKALREGAPWYRPTPASRAAAAPREPSWRATGATSTQCTGAASTTAPTGCAASPWGPCGPRGGEVMCCSPGSRCLAHLPRTMHRRDTWWLQCYVSAPGSARPVPGSQKEGSAPGGPAPPWLCPLTRQSSPAQHGAAGRRLRGELSCALQASRTRPWRLLLLLPVCSLSAASLGSTNACLILLVMRLCRGLAFLLLYLQSP